MKSDRKIFIAFILNLVFSAVEFVGGALTGSVAVAADAIHDLGDSLSIGVSCILEKISKKNPDDSHTYGYVRYSLLGGVITTAILFFSSLIVILKSINRIINPVEINYDGVILLAVFGTVVNFVAAYFTHGGHSLNQKAINLHMLEDVLGWIVVLVSAVVMKFTGFNLIDPILSIVVSVFIFINAGRQLKNIVDIFLEKTPKGIEIDEIREHLLKIPNVLDVHHIHIRTIDGYTNSATLHIVTDGDFATVKKEVKQELTEHGISHTTVEMEGQGEGCADRVCQTEQEKGHHHHHHHHH